MEHKTEKRFHNLTHDQVQALDKVLTEVIPIHGRGNFPTLQVRAKDIIRVVKDRLVERDIQVKDIRLNGATASHVLVRDNGLGYRDLDIIFGVELPRQEDFQVIKEVVLGSLRDLLPCGVNRRKITCLTMKEAYVQKMVKVFNEHDRWSLILLSNNRSKTVGLRFVSSLRRQFEFSVDSFQIILDRMLESYWENDRREEGKLALNARYSSKGANGKENNKTEEQSGSPQDVAEEDAEKDGAMATNSDPPRPEEAASAFELPDKESEGVDGQHEVKGAEGNGLQQVEEGVGGGESVHPEAFELCEERAEQKQLFAGDYPSEAPPKTVFPDARDPLTTRSCLKPQATEEAPPTNTEKPISQEMASFAASTTLEANIKSIKTESSPTRQDSRCEYSFPPPAKKTCSTSQDIVPDYCPSPKLQRKMSRKLISQPEKWSLLTDVSDITTQLFPPIEIVKPLQPKHPVLESVETCGSNVLCAESEHSKGKDAPTVLPYSPERTPPTGAGSCEPAEQTVKPKHSKKPPDLKTQRSPTLTPQVNDQGPEPPGPVPESPPISAQGEPVIAVEAECMYGDFEQAMDHLRRRLIATHNPEEIRGGGLLKYSDLLVRNFRPASETEIKSLERYMCSRFFIDFPDVGEQQRKIEAYLQCHFVGSEEASKYDYLMTLRRVIDESTVCLMGHERRQTLNMITVLALRVLGEQNAIPNTANVTCFYQPAPYVTEPIYNSYYIPQAQPPLVYHPYPLHVHMQSGLV